MQFFKIVTNLTFLEPFGWDFLFELNITAKILTENTEFVLKT